MTAVQLQMEYLELARKYTEDRYGADVDDATADVLARWESVLTSLAEDPMLAARELDWVAKLQLLEGYRARDHLGWSHPRLQLVDLQYADVRSGPRPVQPAGRPGPDEPPGRRAGHRRGPSTSRRRTPGRTSAAAACRSTPTRSPPRRGTR